MPRSPDESSTNHDQDRGKAFAGIYQFAIHKYSVGSVCIYEKALSSETNSWELFSDSRPRPPYFIYYLPGVLGSSIWRYSFSAPIASSDVFKRVDCLYRSISGLPQATFVKLLFAV